MVRQKDKFWLCAWAFVLRFYLLKRFYFKRKLDLFVINLSLRRKVFRLFGILKLSERKSDSFMLT